MSYYWAFILFLIFAYYKYFCDKQNSLIHLFNKYLLS